MTTIHTNGSKFLGDPPDTLDVLVMRLRTEVLDRFFAPFAKNEGKGVVRFFGNFLTYSHAFDIVTDDLVVIAELFDAIAWNMGQAEYKVQPTREQTIAESRGRNIRFEKVRA